MHYVIISASVRDGRKSHQVAGYLKKQIENRKKDSVEILDLLDYDFPIFHERLKNQKDPSDKVLDFVSKFNAADGVIIVTPEYNGGYPASIKNVVDLLNDEWKRKPVAISTVSDGMAGGAQVTISLQFSLWKLGALTVPALLPNPKVLENFDGNGNHKDPEAMAKRANRFLDELAWVTEAKKRMEA